MVPELIKRGLIKIIIILPIIFIFCYIYKYGITIPYWDQWEHVTLLEKFHNHTLNFSDLWSQHNEHRIFFPKILMLILSALSGWNIFVELCTNIILAGLNLCFLFLILNDTSDSKNNAVLKIVVSLLLFSMIQYENWSWGWQIQIFMFVLGGVIAIWSVNKWQGKLIGLIVSILATVMSTYSFGSGLVIWPTVFFILIIQKKWKFKHIIIWIISCLVTVVPYYHKHTGSSFDIPMTYFLSHPIIFMKYVLSYLGAPLAQSISSANWTAVILIVVAILAMLDIRKLKKERFNQFVPWFALIIFVILSACVTGMGRMHLGLGQAMASRYTTISTLFVISVFVLLYNSIQLNLEKKKKIALKDILFIVIVSTAFCVIYVKSYRHGINEMKARDVQINGAAFCLEDPDSALDEDLKRLYPHPDIVRERIKTLSGLGITFDKEK